MYEHKRVFIVNQSFWGGPVEAGPRCPDPPPQREKIGKGVVVGSMNVTFVKQCIRADVTM